jgi:formylglycine-generating enzyme required for sulfatase activity
MNPKPSTPELAFSKALRSFQTGGIAYTDFIAQVRVHLAAGASASALLDILKRREIVESLPDYAHDAVVGLLQALPPQPAAPPQPAVPPQPAAPPGEAITVVLDEVESEGDGTPPPAEVASRGKAIAVGDILLGRFRLLELVGEGGMSRVYKAIDSLLAKDSSDPFMAVKVLTRQLNEESESFPALRAEIQNLRRLTHPNIVRMFGCERDGSTVLIIMEYLEGESLYAKLRARSPAGVPRRGLDRDEAQSIITAVAGALDYAHRDQVVHGDLKPGNVIVTNQGEVKVIDFGIASWIARPKTSFERPGAAQTKTLSAVTPRYASPQLMARQKPEPVDDVYSLACLVYELMTGCHPFDDGKGAQTAKFPPPHRPELTTFQYTAVVNGLQHDRQHRTPTVRKFMDGFAASGHRNVWAGRTIWASVAMIVLVVIWFYTRPPPKPQSALPPAAPSVTPAPSLPAPALAPASPPPSQAPAKQGTVLRDCPTCPLMVVLPIGRFNQGSASSPFERPRHEVVIDYSLAISANDVTVGDFREFIAATNRDMQGCDIYDGDWHHQPTAGWRNPGFTQTALHPVTCVSWNDATAYARWLSSKTAHRYRLPSASEWEYASRAGGEAVRPWDAGGSGACSNADVADQSAARRYPGWSVFACDDGYVYTAPVGSFKANTFGLNDMLGNVFQWTQDCWHGYYGGARADGSARSDGDCAERELRGGSWFSSPSYVRASYRNHFAADYRTSSVGFRLVRELKP